MAIIPRSNPQDIHDVGSLPQARNTTVVRPVQGIDQVGAQFGRILADKGQEIQQRTDEAAVMAAHAKVNDEEFRLFDPSQQDGIGAYGGMKSKDGLPALMKQRDAVAQQARTGLTENQQRAFDKLDFGSRDQFNGRLHSWGDGQYEKGLDAEEDANRNSFIKTGVQAGVRGDSAGSEQNLGKAMSATYMQVLRKTGSEEAANDAQDGVRSSFHYATALGILRDQSGGPLAAKAYMERYGDQITDPEQRRAIDSVLEPAIKEAKYESFGDANVNGGLAVSGDVSPVATPKFPYKETDDYVRVIRGKVGNPTGTNSEVAAQVMDALVHRESNGNQGAVSGKGARGVAQLMPATARTLESQLGMKPGQTDTDANANRKAGQTYLKQMLDRYNGNLDLALAAYNAGPGAVDKWVKTSQIGAPRQVAGGTAHAPADTLEQAIERAKAQSKDPVEQKGFVDATKRAWSEKRAIEADQDRSISESIFQKVYSDDKRPLEQQLTPGEMSWAIKSGKLDAFKGEQKRINAVVSDPGTVSNWNRMFYDAANPTSKTGATALKNIQGLNPYDPSLQLSTEDRQHFADARLKMLSKDEKAQGDWATESQRVSDSYARLGFDKYSKDKKAAMEDAFTRLYRNNLKAFVQQYGAEPKREQADKLMEETRNQFTHQATTQGWFGKKTSPDAVNKRLNDFDTYLSNPAAQSDIALARAWAKKHGISGSDAQIVQLVNEAQQRQKKGTNAN